MISFSPIKCKTMNPPKENIFPFLKESIHVIKDKDILFISSKVLSIHQGRCIKLPKDQKDELIKKEADFYIDRNRVPGREAILTIKNGILIPSAGIDSSNSNDYFTMWPEKVNELLMEIRNYLKKIFGIQNLGVVAIDSRSMILKRGVSGTCIGCAGISMLQDKRGSLDLFGRELKITIVNAIESLSATANLLMGEGDEGHPFLMCSGFDGNFVDKITYQDALVSIEEDIYRPLLEPFFKKQ